MARPRPTSRRRPPQRSLYRKLRIVLVEADRRETQSTGELVANLQARGYPDFTRYRTLEDGSAAVVPCSSGTTARAVELAVALGFVDSANGHPTREGSQGLDLPRFDKVLADGVERLLDQMGSPLAEIQRVSARLLETHEPNRLPTWENIAEELGITDGPHLHRFRTCLGLLEAAGRIDATRRKIYTPQ